MNQAALSYIEKTVAPLREQAHCMLKNVLLMSNVTIERLQQAKHNIAQHGRVALHFHPDHIDSRGLTVAQGLLKDGVYKTQFETHISNGQLAPELGGIRDHWENQFFGHAYAGIQHRPKYGALDFGLNPYGPAPRFGSCYLLSHCALLKNCSFSYMDSHRLLPERGTLACFEVVLAALLTESFERQSALGVNVFDPDALIAYLCSFTDIAQRFTHTGFANLDHYIEAQIHDDVSLEEDICALVVDPCYQNTPMDETLQALANQYDITLYYHQGYQMDAAHTPNNFRGACMPALAKQVARQGVMTPFNLGVATLRCTEELASWQQRDMQQQQLQQLKLLWHVLVKFGVNTTPLS
ncbi:DUF3626 domain-containing protein [Shewanella intestini]|nr:MULTISPECIES: DUF3626 domain-containing protein [Shewanella]